jgi:hypothetical protein
MRSSVIVNAALGIAAEIFYTFAIMLVALATCLAFSVIKL